MTVFIAFAALAAVLCAVLWRDYFRRLDDVARYAGERSSRARLAVVGGNQCLSGDQFLHALISRLKSGESVADALEDMDRLSAENPCCSLGVCDGIKRRLQADSSSRNVKKEVIDAVNRICAQESEEDRVFLGVSVGICVVLCDELGCPLVEVLRSLQKLYAQRKTRADLIRTAFAMPKATVGVLAVLPLVVDGGGIALGAHPVRFLIATFAGRICCAIGLVLLFVGVVWTRRLLSASVAPCDGARRLDEGIDVASVPQFCFFVELVSVAIGHGASIPDALLGVVRSCAPIRYKYYGSLYYYINYFYLKHNIYKFEYQSDVSSEGDALPMGLSAIVTAAHAVQRGADWQDAWFGALSPLRQRGDGALVVNVARLQECLEPMWLQGARSAQRLSALADEMAEEEDSAIRSSAASLTVRLLVPLGLCFLPMFIVIAVIPLIASFAMNF